MNCLKLIAGLLYKYCLLGYIGYIAAVRANDPDKKLYDHLARVVGGQRVQKREDFAYQASVRVKFNNALICGASIIDETHTLTAAHCCFNGGTEVIAPNLLHIVAGDIDQSNSNNFTIYRNVINIFTHKGYNPMTVENDIAMLRVDETFEPWSIYVHPIMLATKLPHESTNCTVSGWGKIDESYSTVSGALYTAVVPIIPLSLCRKAYPKNLRRGMFCAGYMAGHKDACQGDSGGPLVCNRVLTGIVSWGEGCGRVAKPGVYTDISLYLDWIRGETRRSEGISFQCSVFVLNNIIPTIVILVLFN